MSESRFPPVEPPEGPYVADVRRFCLDLPDVWEDYPWGDIVFKVGAKMFAAFGTSPPLAVTVKATPEDASTLVQFPHVSVAPYIGRHGWVRIVIEDEAALDQALALIHMSYDLVREAGSRKRRRTIY